MSIKQDRIGTRTSEDLRRRLNVKAIDESIEKVDKSTLTIEQLNTQVTGINDSLNNTRNIYVSTQQQTFTEAQKTRARNNIGAGTSSFSGSYRDLTNKPTIPTKTSQLTNDSNFVKDSNYVHTDNNYTTAEKNKLSAMEISNIFYGLSTYKVDDLTILRSSCMEKNGRVCINFVGTLPMNANTTTTLFNLPSGLRPSITKDFVVFGQSSNNDGYIGYGYITPDGLLQVRFNETISSYIRFSAVYDL